MTKNIRIALFADSFLEVDGAAMTCRRLVDFAKERDLPLLCIHAGQKTGIVTDGSITYLTLKRSGLALSMDHDLAYDPLFQRHCRRVLNAIEDFKPDVLHITGLNDVSIIGAYLGWKTQTPILGSWHTNLHEFAAQRLRTLFRPLGSRVSEGLASFAQKWILSGAQLYYRMPQIILAPNEELIRMLENGTGRAVRLMARGVDRVKFAPSKRTVTDGVIRLGFVGRLQPEKGVRKLVEIEKSLISNGCKNFEFLIVGAGSEREYLEKNLVNARFTGLIKGEELSAAYANMDVFLFPSETDTFGNVVQEAMSSGVPAIVSGKGGPKYIIEEGVDGFVARNNEEWVSHATFLLDNPAKLGEMKLSARKKAVSRSWDAIFERVYENYAECLSIWSQRNSRNIAVADATKAKLDDGSPDRFSLKDVVVNLLRHPVRNVLLKWNWKSALLSAMMRSPIFFTVYFAQKQGLWIAVGAMAVQFAFRTFFGGINGAILQAFCKVHPAWHAVITVPFILAAVSHIFEFGLQTAYDSYAGSKGKGGAVIVSISISIVSALFNLFAMRRGVLLVRDESGQSLWRDLKQMPSIALEFLSFPLTWTWRKAKKA